MGGSENPRREFDGGRSDMQQRLTRGQRLKKKRCSEDFQPRPEPTLLAPEWKRDFGSSRRQAQWVQALPAHLDDSGREPP
jgi:hypothetical protein